MPSNPVIVVPGITATFLRDEYPISPEVIWAVLSKDYARSVLHPDDLRYEAIEPARVRADKVFEVAYKDLIDELRYNLSETEDLPVPVYPFGYDWRQPLEPTAAHLGDMIDEVIDRTRLMRHYHGDGAWSGKVDLVGHSMGGLVIATYVARHGGAKIGKVATLATPYRGSYEAVVKVATGTADLGTSAPSSREREAARVTPALYHLLPDFDNAVSVPLGLPSSLFEVGIWQPSILSTLAEFIRLRGVEPPREMGDRINQARALMAGMLSVARDNRALVDGLSLADAGMDVDDWLCVAGAGATTRVELTVGTDEQGRPQFAFAGTDRDDAFFEAGAAADRRMRSGDGTVPIPGSIPTFIPRESVVVVTPKDFGYWEWRDQGLSYLSGFHGILPNMNMLHRLLVRHFTGRPDNRRNTWGRPLPGVTRDDWNPPMPLFDMSRND